MARTCRTCTSRSACKGSRASGSGCPRMESCILGFWPVAPRPGRQTWMRRFSVIDQAAEIAPTPHRPSGRQARCGWCWPGRAAFLHRLRPEEPADRVVRAVVSLGPATGAGECVSRIRCDTSDWGRNVGEGVRRCDASDASDDTLFRPDCVASEGSGSVTGVGAPASVGWS